MSEPITRLAEFELPLGGNWAADRLSMNSATLFAEFQFLVTKPFDLKEQFMWRDRINAGDLGKDAFVRAMKEVCYWRIRRAADELEKELFPDGPPATEPTASSDSSSRTPGTR